MKISGRHLFLLFVILFISLSCGRVTEKLAEPTAKPTETATVKKTATMQEPTQEPAQTMKVDNGIVSEKCSEGIAALGDDENISGTIVLYFNNGSTYNLIFFDTTTHKTIEITPHYFENTSHILFLNGVSVSPDGGYLAYQTGHFVGEEYIGNKINIINAENEKITEIDNLFPMMYFEWLNNEILITPTAQEKNPLILIEIASGHTKNLYPIIDEGSFLESDFVSSWFSYGLHKNIYNFDLTRVVYPDYENDYPIIKMRNMENNSDILTIPTNIGWGSSPVWSPDGNYFAIAIADDRDRTEEYIYIFNRDGEVVFQTDKSSTNMQEAIYSLSWSPDSKLLAFHYVIGESSARTHHLGILDFEDKKVTTYCSPDVYLSSPYWSPDSQYLLYPSQVTDSDELSSYVLNIETGQNTLVMDGYFPGGWMK